MIDINTKLTVLHDDNGSFIDNSNAAADFLRDEFTMSLNQSEDYLYLGFNKPFGMCYVALTAANVNSNQLTVQYYNGTSWVTLEANDETNGLIRSGYITWDRTNMAALAVNGISKYYIRIRPSVTHSATVVRGINIVFADDNALKQEFFEIDNESLLPTGETSHLVNHVSARNTLVQMLRNQGYDKNPNNTKLKQITAWDIMDLEYTKQAAVMLTLSKIFFGKSDSREDVWWAKYNNYQDKFKEAFELIRLPVDLDDDGLEDNSENKDAFVQPRWSR